MAIPILIPGKTTSKNGLINNRWNIFRGFFGGIDDIILRTLESLSKIAKIESHISSKDPNSGLSDSSTDYEQKKCATVKDSSKTDSDLLDGISEMKASLQEALASLDLLGNYVESPSEENAKPLHKFADRERRNGLRATFLEENSKRAVENYLTFVEMLDVFKSSKGQDMGMETKVNLLNDKIPNQGEKIKALSSENQEILADYGELLFEKRAKENKERKAEVFIEIFPTPQVMFASNEGSSDQNPNYKTGQEERSEANTSNESNSNEAPNGFREPLTTNENINDGEKQNPARQHQLKGKTSSGEGIKSRRREAEIVNMPSTSRDDVAMQDSTQNGRSENEVNGSNKVETSCEDERNFQSNSTRQKYEGLSFSVQQDDSNGRECISLSNKPTTSVATTLYNNYKLLLLTIAQSLLSSDVSKLKVWANQNFSIGDAQNAADVIFKLDEKGVINAEDLSALRDFFTAVIRYDLLHMIDTFLLGDYSFLREVPGPKIHTAGRRTSRFLEMSTFIAEIPSPRAGDHVGDQATARKPPNSKMASFPNSLKKPSTAPNPTVSFRSRNENQPTAHEQQEVKTISTGFSSNKVTDVLVSDGSASYGRRTITANPLIKTNPSLRNSARNTQTFGSNGLKLSKPQRRNTEQTNGFNSRNPGTSRNQQALDQDDNWLCNHYKRHCYVKFDCCDKFWPCHRCHNNQSNCGRKKLKSRDTKMVKCVYCNKEQPFGEFCCDCNAKFASYFCGLCLHLTGKDDHPYHCEKCGICRIHGDRSFHCDVCGVCLDVQLRGNHKCREGSAHDECCICLEDAFTGCQILPCSHKVHKECATQMIRSGITRCPICRESFAHKLERRPVSKSGKRFGK